MGRFDGTGIADGSLDTSATRAPADGAGVFRVTVAGVDSPVSSWSTSVVRLIGGDAARLSVALTELPWYAAVRVTVSARGIGLNVNGTAANWPPAGTVTVGGKDTALGSLLVRVINAAPAGT